MNILVLSSVNPKFGHGTSADYLVLAHLLEEIAISGNKVSFATVNPPNELEENTIARFKKNGIFYFGDFTDAVELKPNYKSRFSHNIMLLKEFLLPSENDDYPRFKNPEKTVHRLQESGADVFLLFWDSCFQHLLPFIKNPKVVGYFAKSPHASAMARFKSNYFAKKLLQRREERHLERLHSVAALSNICTFDTNYYRKAGFSCLYIPNTWPDLYGNAWFEKRQAAESERKHIGILGNIGSLAGTGNSFGLKFLAERVLPSLSKNLSDIDWEINICGGGEMDKLLREKLQHPRVNIKGFVPDIEEEIISNPFFLLLNSSGPHTGAYTRVLFAFSSGSCLIAHKNLALSMPEVKHGYNALLGNSANEIVALIRKAAKDKEFRSMISRNARETYEKYYQPKKVAEKILNMLQSCVN
ncbi:glycosyltransferase [Candidatus Peregrinibacteria bacterium]|nr:glycosyltransferase [Candidatus Peregrinibacteria bacterium]